MTDAHLDALYALLQAEGLTVGVRERMRVEAVLASAAPARIPSEKLAALLAAVVVKSKDERQRFDRAFALWPTTSEARPPSHADTTARPAQPSKGHRAGRILYAVALIAGVALMVWLVGPGQEHREPDPEPDAEATDAGVDPGIDAGFARTFRRPTIEIRPGEPSTPDHGWDAGLLIGALGLLGFAIWRARQTPPPLPTVDALSPEDPAPTPLEALPDRRPVDRLLGNTGREAMVWGIDHFVGEHPTRDIDLPASVDATVRAGGLPTLVHTRERHAREVWLWVDELAARAHPEIDRLATEIGRALRSAGLPFEVARFEGVPDDLMTADDQRFSPAEIDARRDVARVAVLTDGLWLTTRARARRGRRPADMVRLLRTLAHWPAVAFADFARGAHGLDGLLADFGLTAVAPEAIGRWLGGQPQWVPFDATDVHLWAGACALCPEAVDRTTALQLRDALAAAGLSADAWAIARLADDAAARGALRWSVPDARRRIAHLTAVEAGDASLFAVARAFWLDRWRAAEESAPGASDREHRAAHRALMQLWTDAPEAIDAAARTLVALRGRLQPDLDERLRHMCPRIAGACPAEAFPLPWDWEAQSPVTRRRLRAAGLAAAFPALEEITLRPASRAWVVAGLAAAWAIVAAIGLLTAEERPPSGPPTCDGWPLCRPTEGPDERWSVLVGDGRAWTIETTEAGAVVSMAAPVDAPCIDRGGDPTEGTALVAMRCGRSDTPAPTPDAWPARNVAFVAAPIDDADLRARVARLIDGGGLHVAYFVGDRPWPDPAVTMRRLDPADQVLFVGGEPPAAERWRPAAAAWMPLAALPAADAAFGSTAAPIADVYPSARVLAGAPLALPASGDRACPYQEQTFDGVVYVRVCGGTFPMGSNDGALNEQPVRDVTVSGFWMGKYEVTNGQYRGAGHPDHQPDEPVDWPVSGVSWTEARAFCEQVGGRLPTEAEWEYAARGPDGRTYPWGDAAPTAERAVGPESMRAEPVGSRPAGRGPFGTLDQSGNVWEWVADCYADDAYRRGVDTDPFVDTADCGQRVLRGGGFDFEASFLRSAVRLSFRPDFRNRFIGFRCVRGSRPEPTLAP